MSLYKMDILFLRPFNSVRRMLLSVTGMVVVLIALVQFWGSPSWSYIATQSAEEEGSVFVMFSNATSLSNSDLLLASATSPSNLVEKAEREKNDVSSNNNKDANAVTIIKDTTFHNRFSKGSRDYSMINVGSWDAESNTSGLTHRSLIGRAQQVVELEPEGGSVKIIKVGRSSSDNDTLMIEKYVRKIRGQTTTISEMNLMVHHSIVSSGSLPSRSSKLDLELLNAKVQIRNAPVSRNIPDLYAPIFRNVSIFRSTEMLRMTLYEEKSPTVKKLENYLTNYVNLVKKRYHFWNRTGGADHFFVACHDWAPRITRKHMSNCIRVLCNANVAGGFSIGKDVSLPVTYIRSGNDPLRDLGGQPPSKRPILVFFAGGMHGYLRPILLQYWEDKFPDMKIFGPMSRDIEGKAVYRGYMKSSKYCICARGYEVHTPRVVESIFYECVPVIVSDNYVPPFFQILNWEAFSVFILEKDIPNLRNILLSIPEERYLEMQQRVKMAQRHFFWHKIPEKYDLFHMILHSIWFSRVSLAKP
ncbi:hypothetical protein Nepgr_025663 [Nepenthes gracilis]|uniref:Exostosin GT47 domain-containing protein n=1 Tax=Nepenthes gracilis TaxID=150966 RepID=A0AAD3Y1C3_NEPGR|nr:hypothetical protein Nepgr_025663 [Nepenthes gracilis]